MDSLILYHGSNVIVERPCLERCRPNNDYGKGFYCTESIDLAREWACGPDTDGYCNMYSLDMTGLNVLDLDSGKYSILNWLAILLHNRTVDLNSNIAIRGNRWIIENYLVDLEEFDVIRGYRADDAYFSFVRSFLNNTITMEQLESSMKPGDLGIQYMVKTPEAFSALGFISYEHVDSGTFWTKRDMRNMDARNRFRAIQAKEQTGRYLSDIMKEASS